METSNNHLYCYNKGCGQRFDPASNSSNSCVHHPGIPVFHDAYKSWSCCQKKTTDFTEFLSIKGCTTSCHNAQKPPPEETKTNIVIKQDNEINNVPLQKKINSLSVRERPVKTLPTVPLSFTVTPSLKSLLEKLENAGENAGDIGDETDITQIPVGTSCKNGGCRKTYTCETDNSEECLYHTGQPVFHEGLKFWSCCVRRTSDFNAFLDQVGCTTGSHLWLKAKNTERDGTSCRYDWYQTGPQVFFSVYAKSPIPTLSSVKANQVLLNVHLIYGEERQSFDLDLDLFGVIEVEKCEVTYSPNKVEIKLKKGEPANWAKLILPPRVP